MQTDSDVTTLRHTRAATGQTLSAGIDERTQQSDASRVVGMFGSNVADDDQLLGAEITHAGVLLGRVEGLFRDAISQRVWRLLTSYGLAGRRVAVPMEWVVSRSPTRLVLAVGARSLDDLSDWTRS